MQIYNKLVRDKIIEKIESNGETPIYRVLTIEECKRELIKKLDEEYTEVKTADNSKNLLEECCDMMEILFSIGKLEGVTEEEMLEIMKEKRKKRGSFDKRIFLERVK